MAALRRTIAICRDVATSAYGDVQDVPGFLAEARAKMAAVEVAGDEGAVRIGDRVVAVMDEMEKRGDNPEKHVITTGISSLDDIIVGLFPKTVSIIAANPSRGKTALALNTIIRVALRGIPCLFFSLEMSTNQIIERALTYASRVNGRSVQAGRMSGPEWLRVQRAANEWIRTSLPAWVDDRVLTADKLCAYARRWRARVRAERLAAGMDKNEAELALVAIDYLGLVRGDDDSESRRLEVAAMSRKFKQLAKDESIAVLECAQLSRANMKDAKEPRAPILSDLRDAGEIEQDGDVIMFPWWTGTPAMVGPHEGVILVRKNRNGPTGDAKVYWEREYMTFSGRGDEEDDQPVLVR
jgi:replicative DNA helicase